MADGTLTPMGRVARGGATAFAIYLAGAGLTYGSQLLIARMVGVDTFGIYSYVYAWMVVLAYCATLGFDVALLRFLPAYQAEDAWALLKGIILYAQRRAAAVGISVISVGMLIILVIAPEIPAEIRNTFLVGFALVPVWALL